MILILGYGFLGKSFSDFLKKRKVKHLVASKNVANKEEDTIKFINFDLNEIEPKSHIFDDIEVVIHLIHSTVPYTSTIKPTNEVISDISNNIKLFSILGNKGVRKIIYISSGGAIYGMPTYPLVKETDPCNPISPYGISKLTIENFLIFFSKKNSFKYIILRPSNVYGREYNFNKNQGIVNNILCSLVGSKKLTIWGKGDEKKDYLYIDDFCEALYTVVKDSKIKNQIFNLASGETLSVNEIIVAFEKYTGNKFLIENESPKQFDVQSIALDNSKFKNTYNWIPKCRLNSSIPQILND